MSSLTFNFISEINDIHTLEELCIFSSQKDITVFLLSLHFSL